MTPTKIMKKIFKCHLVDEYQEDERKVKLNLIKKDMQAFDALLFKPKDQYIKESNNSVQNRREKTKSNFKYRKENGNI